MFRRLATVAPRSVGTVVSPRITPAISGIQTQPITRASPAPQRRSYHEKDKSLQQPTQRRGLSRFKKTPVKTAGRSLIKRRRILYAVFYTREDTLIEFWTSTIRKNQSLYNAVREDRYDQSASICLLCARGGSQVSAFFKLLINHVHASSGTDIFVVGSLPKDAPDVGLGLVGAPACGDVMKLQIRVDKDTSKITDVKFKTFGCGSAIASSSYLTELVRGMTLDEAAKIRNTDIAKELCLPPVKLHCSMLAEDAIKSAINDYYTKNPKAAKTDLSGTAASIPNVEKTDGSTASL
ncbi:iron sulfur cluster assembly protein 1, mitochondrial [Aspergillus lentulus]|uniref:Iron sulfur cluster assembly protein 1, mitochondrial n=1 Tax=Aspergillus lentulus TaxID=293939 RepID=A0AAN4PKN1_ASPLE|nr:hypothetical protein CNMCM8060_001518 [Aspergillus lentulus]KAF4195415.1 hypothetical protein CNMCM8694_006341 [Aspergillus lentulus]GAQ07841.1 iron sulfur cluster assembly protein 1, mitochondrial [Aspergillus lentulus]